MCDVEFDGCNDFTNETLRVARKEHRCSECRKTIRAGERYTYRVAKYDGSLNQDKDCSRCSRVREAHVKTERSMGGNGSYYVGELLSMVVECSQERYEYLERFRKAWKGEALPEYVKPPTWEERARARIAQPMSGPQ